MKFLLYIAVACLCSVLRSQNGGAQTEGLRAHFQLGHFARDIDLLKKAFDARAGDDNLPNGNYNGEEEEINSNDYSVSGNDCMDYLHYFRIFDYKLVNLDELVLLDSCLGYLYRSEFHEIDIRVSGKIRDNLQSYIDDPVLRDLFTQTGVENLSDEAMGCLTDLLHEYITTLMNQNYCSEDWEDALEDFADCHRTITQVLDIERDSYLKIIYSFLPGRGKECFENQAHILHENVHLYYEELTKVSCSLTALTRDQTWPKPIEKLLKAVQGTKQKLDLEAIGEIVAGISRDDHEHSDLYENIFTKNIAAHMKVINPLAPSRLMTYQDKVEKMCQAFRTYHFFTPIIEMVDMLRSPEIYGVTKEQFVSTVLVDNKHRGLYLCVAICEYLHYTVATLSQTRTGVLSYEVKFERESNMIRWPDISIKSS